MGLGPDNNATNDSDETIVTDAPQQGVSTILNLTTTAQEGKVGGSPLAKRRYVEFEALTKNVMWGYNTDCDFSLSKKGFYSLPCGEGCTIYFKASTGTADVAFSEK